MRIAIVGAGNVGSALAAGFMRTGHDVVISSRDAADAEALATAVGATAASANPTAVEGADVVVLSIPTAKRSEVAAELAGVLAGKAVIDVTNVINADMTGLTTERSGAEDLQDMLPGARLVKAFNTVFASQQADPIVDGLALDGYYAGDDVAAKSMVRELLAGLGYRPVDAGPLRMARVLEDMALLNVRLSALDGWGWSSGYRLLGSGPSDT